MKKIIRICFILLVIYALFQGGAYLRSDQYRCHQLEKQLMKELNLTYSKIEVKMRGENTVYIWYECTPTRALYEIQQALNEKMADETFWMTARKMNYIIQARALDARGIRDGTVIWNKNPFDEKEYSRLGISMRTVGDFSLPEGYSFDDVRYLYTVDDRDSDPSNGMEEYTCLQYFPNLEYLNLGNEEITSELFEIIRQQVPKDCEIVEYRIKD